MGIGCVIDDSNTSWAALQVHVLGAEKATPVRTYIQIVEGACYFQEAAHEMWMGRVCSHVRVEGCQNTYKRNKTRKKERNKEYRKENKKENKKKIEKIEQRKTYVYKYIANIVM